MTIYAEVMRKWNKTVKLMKNEINEEKKRRFKERKRNVKKTKVASGEMLVKKEMNGVRETLDDYQLIELKEMKEIAKLEEEKIMKMREEIRKRELALKEQQRKNEIERKKDELRKKREEEAKRKEELARKREEEEAKRKDEMKKKSNIKDEVGNKRKEEQSKDHLEQEDGLVKEHKDEIKRTREIKACKRRQKSITVKKELQRDDEYVKLEDECKYNPTNEMKRDISVVSGVEHEREDGTSTIRSTTRKKRDTTAIGSLVKNKRRGNATTFLKQSTRNGNENGESATERVAKCGDKPVHGTKMEKDESCPVDGARIEERAVHSKLTKDPVEQVTLLQQHLNALEMDKNKESKKTRSVCRRNVRNDATIASTVRTSNENVHEKTNDENNPFHTTDESVRKENVYSGCLISALDRSKIEQLQGDVSKRLAEKIAEESKNVLKPKNNNVQMPSFGVDITGKIERVPETSHNEENINPDLEKERFHKRMIENSQLVEELMKPFSRRKSSIKIFLPKKASSSHSSSNGDLKDENNSYVRRLNIYKKKHHQTRRQLRRQHILIQKNKQLNQAFEKVKNLFLEKKIRESILVNNSLMDQSIRVEENNKVDQSVRKPLFEVPGKETIPTSRRPDLIYRKAIDKKMSGLRFSTPRKSFDPSSFVPKTNLPSFNAKNEDVFKTSFKKKAWAVEDNITDIVSNQNHFEIEQYFSAPAIDICAMFPAARSISNDSPNKFVTNSQ